MRLIEVEWKQGLLGAGWLIASPSVHRNFLFPHWRLWRIPRDLRNPKLTVRFDQLVHATTFKGWWHETCGAEGSKLFNLKFPSGAWNIPWELLIKYLTETRNLATVCLTRSLANVTPLAPSRFDEPLRVLVLQGDNGESMDQRLDLEKAARDIQIAWESLEKSIRDCVEKPVVERATQANLPSLLSQHRPHMLWFNGHGRAKPSASLLLADQEWVDAVDFASLIRQSGRSPLYAVFWACDTGRPGAPSNTALDYPTLVQELGKVGLLSVLAMQSPIRDASALAMASDLFRFLATGLPLEQAVARARANMITGDYPADAHELDWASPVVWTAGQVVEHLEWNLPTQPLAQLQLIGRQAMRSQLTPSSQMDGRPSRYESYRANVWASLPRIWVYGFPQDSDHLYHWMRTLQAIHTHAQRFVIAVEMRHADPAAGLQDWAQSLRERLVLGDIPLEIAQILSDMANVRNVVLGWRRLCQFHGAYLAIANPPDYRSADWFWEPLLSGKNGLHVAILSDQPISTDIQRDWALEQVEEKMDEQALVSAIHQSPGLARTLAMLNMPFGATYIEKSGWSLQDWTERENVLIETPDKLVMMTATARKYVLSNLDSDQKKQAHLDCVKILGHHLLSLNLQIREKRLEHLLGADLMADAVVEATILCQQYREENRPFAVIRVVERLGASQVDLPSSARLCVAWANLQLGKLPQAKHWLDHSRPTSPLEIAWKHGMKAELYKSEGKEHSKDLDFCSTLTSE